MNKLIQRSLLNAVGTIAYVAIVASVMFNGERIFGEVDTIAIPVTLLLLFIVSAMVTSGLVLGKPVLMYLDGQKKEAVQMLIYTVGWLALAVILLLIANVIV